MSTEEKIEIMQACADGKQIQSKAVLGEHWCDDSNPSWDWNLIDCKNIYGWSAWVIKHIKE